MTKSFEFESDAAPGLSPDYCTRLRFELDLSALSQTKCAVLAIFCTNLDTGKPFTWTKLPEAERHRLAARIDEIATDPDNCALAWQEYEEGEADRAYDRMRDDELLD